MKKFLLSVLAVAGTALLSSAQTSTTFIVNGTTYEITGTATVSIADVDTEAAEIVIPETVENEAKTYTVTAVGERAFNYAKAAKIVLPNTVTEIGYCGVYNTSATTIQLSAALKTLGQNALAYNENVIELTIPEGVTEIPSSCFSNNQKMTTINLPASIETIGNGAFYKAPITSFTFPTSLRTIGNNVFQLAPNLAEVTLNANIEQLGEGTFRQCVKLTKVNMEAATKLTEIPADCFVECNTLAEFTIPATIKEIGMNAFGNTAITEYKVAEGNREFVAENGCVYQADKSIIWLYPPKKAGDEFTIPDGVRGIGGGSFYGAAVKKVILPESIVAIDSYAFCEAQISEINLPNSILQIGEQAFAGTQLANLVLPEKIIAIHDGLAAWSNKLTSVTIPADVRMVANHAFQRCKALTSVTCKSGVAPEVLDYYGEEDNPFGYVDRSNVTLNIPKGSKQSYIEMGWADLFSNIVESEPAVLVPVSSNPASKAVIEQLGTVEITFPETAEVVTSNPKIILRSTNEIIGEEIKPEGGWIAVNNSSDKKTVTVFPADYDGFTMPISLNPNEPYFLIIPAGTFKNDAGALNQKIVIEVIGAVPSFNPVTFTPASNSEVTEIGTIEITFNEAATVASRNPKVTVKKGDASTGEELTADGGWIAVNNSNDKKTVTVFPADYDGFTSPLAVEPEVTYYVTIPAGTFKNANGTKAEEIQLVYIGKGNSSVDGINAGKCAVYCNGSEICISLQDLGTCEVAVFDIMGRLLAAQTTSSSTALSVDGSGIYVVKVIAQGKTYTFKVHK